MSYLKFPRRTGAASVLALAAGLAWSADAFAQAAANAPNEVRELEVTASRYQAQQQIYNRDQALTVVDTLIQDDTGDLSDQSISEALRRVPGVTTLYDEDEGQFVTVRGISPEYNHVTLDGMTLASVGNNGSGARQVDLSLIPSQSARKAEVYKTFTADLDASAIGGVLNIVSRSAYDTKKTYGVFDLFGNYFTYNDVPGINSRNGKTDSPWGGGFNAAFSKRFGGDEQFGLVFSANYQTKQRDETKYNTNTRAYYSNAGKLVTPTDPTWNGIAIPDQFVMYNYTDQIQNGGASARFEYKPSDRFYVSLLAFDYIQRESETRNTNNLLTLDLPTNITPTSGTMRVGEGRAAYYSDSQHRANHGAVLSSRWQADDDSVVDVAAGYTYSQFKNTHPEMVYTFNPKSTVNYDTSGTVPTFTLPNPEIYRDASRYVLKSALDSQNDANAQVGEIKVDYTHNLTAGSRGWGYKIGADIQKMSLWRDNSATNYVSDKSTLAGLGLDPHFAVPGYAMPLVFIDNRGFWQTVVPRLAVNEKSSATDSFSQDYKYDETRTAAYASVSYATDKLRVIGGLRYDNNDFTAKSPLTVDGVAQPSFTKSDGKYGHLLPSANLTYAINPGLRLKAGYSRTLGLPSGGDVAKPETRNEDDLTISRGNPNIRPRIADSFDLSLEQYFNDGRGLLTASAFHKKIAHDIFVMSTNRVVDGETYTVKQPENSLSSTIDGVELALIDSRLDFLPGPLGRNLGVSANGVRLWGKMHYLSGAKEFTLDSLTNQSKDAGNIAVFYALPRGGEVRVAYNYQGKFIDSVGASPWLNTGWEAFGALDVTVRHQISDHLIVKLQARNLLDEGRIGTMGETQQYRRVNFEYGHSYYFNLIYKM